MSNPTAAALADFRRGDLVKRTTSICPACLRRVDAEVRQRGSAVWMDKACPDHGPFSALLASDARHYYRADPRVAALGSCCGAGRSCGDQVANHSCNMLIEITQRCNLTCPTCYADSSPHRDGAMTLDAFEALLDGLLGKGKGDADLIQLSGGEPTIHPELFGFIDRALERGIRRVYLNTNGIRLAGRPFAERIASYGRRVGVYLQLDGFEARTSDLLRGEPDLVGKKRAALANCESLGIEVVVVVTLARAINEHEIGAIIDMAAKSPAVHKVMIQPAMYSGRYENPRRVERLTVADVARLISDQTGAFREDDFGPIPCSDPNCFSMALALKTPQGLWPVSRYFPRYATWSEPGVADLVARVSDSFDRADDLRDAMAWAMGNGALDALPEEALDALLDRLAEWKGDDCWSGLLAIGIKPFMDAWTLDQDRIDGCCVHVIARDGTPVSFCEYNAVHRPSGRL